MNKQILFIIVLAFICCNLSAQHSADSVIVRIETSDGNQFTGTIVGQDSATVRLQTANMGILTIHKNLIVSQERLEISKIKNGKIWLHNPQASRYFWSPNGYGLREGEGYYQNIWVFWNQVAYGITDNISLGGAIVPLFLIEGTATPVFGTIKLSVPVINERLHLGTGVIAGTVIGESGTSFGLLYGLGTYGSPDSNASLGIGYGFGGGDSSSPVFNINVMHRVSNRWYLLSENYIFSSEDLALISYGARWIIKRAALDFGLVTPLTFSETFYFIAIPWLGFTVPFGGGAG